MLTRSGDGIDASRSVNRTGVENAHSVSVPGRADQIPQGAS